MTVDRPLTKAQLAEVSRLSSHIEATTTHALIEYQWGNFKHDPLGVLYRYFDGFLYWANWGAPQLGLRFPHGAAPASLLADYDDLDDFVTFTQHPDYDILDIHFAELEGPDEWIEYELGPLLPIRDELMDGDTRAIYIVWLAAQRAMGSNDDEEEYLVGAPPVPPGLGALTGAQEALAELLQAPGELLAAAAHYSTASQPSPHEDVAALIPLLSPERRADYLARLARNEPGLSHKLISELRELRPENDRVVPSPSKRVAFANVLSDSREIAARRERERVEQEWQARERHIRQVHSHPDEYWQRVTEAVERGSGAGYDEATRLLIELREVAERFDESRSFQERFQAWILPNLRRPSFVKRLRDNRFQLPDA